MATTGRGRFRIGTAVGLVALALVVSTAGASAATRTKRASVDSAGAQSLGFSSGTTAIAANGRYIAFESDADDLVPGDSNDTDDIYVHDRISKLTERVSVRSNGAEGDKESESPSISANGRYVAFESDGRLVKGDGNQEQDIFVHDRATGKTKRVSLRSNGAEGDDSSSAPAISADGRFVAFSSQASNLVKHDTIGFEDVFVHDRQTGKTTRVSVRSNGNAGRTATVLRPAISADGRFVAFQSDATNLVPGDTTSAFGTSSSTTARPARRSG